ncbi:LexA family protein [Paeniglutamicibacter sp. MACA_103]|uniref:LexA family protein n=1 Tax=Paeniglutamicibacter sp. MACA_103 TaxID=3377337 RepID=UPI0038946ACE
MFGMDQPQPPAPQPESQGPVGAVEAMGFPSPARDYYSGGIDLNRLLIRDRTSTFLMRVSGNAMASSGISHGDEVIVDRALAPRDGSVVIAVQDGELVIRRLVSSRGTMVLCSDEQPQERAEAVTEETTIWGVVTRCLHHV